MSIDAAVVWVCLDILANAGTEGFASLADRGTYAALTRCPWWTLNARWISNPAVKIQEAHLKTYRVAACSAVEITRLEIGTAAVD